MIIFVEDGSVYLFNKRVMRFFRKDGHNWRKKKDGRTVAEGHERLKVRQHCYIIDTFCDNICFDMGSYMLIFSI